LGQKKSGDLFEILVKRHGAMEYFNLKIIDIIPLIQPHFLYVK